MLLRVPEYYKRFECIADKCKDSCCIGWEINIDEDTYDYYKSVDGAFGKRLRDHMAEGEENSFVLKEDGRCPFLNEKNLCDICLNLGEEALSYVCTEYPRFSIEYGDVIEKNLIMSCEVAGALIFGEAKPFQIEEIDQPDSYEMYEDGCELDEMIESEEECEAAWDLEDVEEQEIEERAKYIAQARDHAIKLLKKRELSIEERFALFLLYSEQVQTLLNEQKIEHIAEIVEQYEGEALLDLVAKLHAKKSECSAPESSEQAERMNAYEELEVLDEEWKTFFEKVKETFSKENCSREDYQKRIKNFMEQYRLREYEYEHCAVYFVFRHMMNSVYDSNFIRYAKFAAAAFLMIRDMDVIRFEENKNKFSLEDRIDVCRIYAKEVEHSEENMESLANAFLFEEVFETDSMIEQILMYK